MNQGGLMNALSSDASNDARAPATPHGESERVITWESFAKAAMELEDLDTTLTLVRERGTG
jgi:hypothetical protein